jgi:exodeoxyribonuclease VII large subunit
MAAEIVVPDRRDVAARVRDLHDRLHDQVTRRIQDARQRIDALMSSRAFHGPVRRLEQQRQRLDALISRLERSGVRLTEQARTRLDRLRSRLAAIDPEQPLRRGYAYPARDGTPVRSAETLQEGDLVRLRFHDGRRSAEVVPEEE